MYKIIDNVRHTRKHRRCFVMNENDGLMWSGNTMGQAIVWLCENGHQDAKLEIDGEEYELNFSLWPI